MISEFIKSNEKILLGCWMHKNSKRFLPESIGGKEKILLGCWMRRNPLEVST